MKKFNFYKMHAAATTIFLFFGLIVTSSCTMQRGNDMEGVDNMKHNAMPMEKQMDDNKQMSKMSKDTEMVSDRDMQHKDSTMQ